MAEHEKLGDASSRGTKLAHQAHTVKSPPRESSTSICIRRYTVLSFWLVVVLLGLPLWWATTSVYRAKLPLNAMNAWAEGSQCSPTLPIRIELVSAELDPTELATMASTTQEMFEESEIHSTHRVLVSGGSRKLDDGHTAPALKVNILARTHSSSSKYKPQLYAPDPVMDVNYDPKLKSAIPSLVTDSVFGLFAEEKAIVSHLFSSNKGIKTLSKSRLDVSADMIQSFEKRRTRSVKYASTYHLTFSLLTPEAMPSDWDVKAALHETIKPLLQGLSSFSNFTIDTQVQPYATFSSSVHPFFDEQRQAWMLKASDLGGFINAAEWPLSPSIGTHPTINFVLYVPSASQSPMLIDNGASSSWLILQWGGIAIHNPTSTRALQQTSRLSAEELKEPLLIFSQHLLDLLGLPSPDLPFQMRLSSQIRLLALRLTSSAASTLGSLARLVQEMPSISIPKSTAESVASTLAHLQASCTALNNGRYQEALSHAVIADEEAAKAFFHKSMVGQVYFPDEHKVAVYLPMLGPMAVPLIMSVLREIKRFRASTK